MSRGLSWASGQGGCLEEATLKQEFTGLGMA